MSFESDTSNCECLTLSFKQIADQTSYEAAWNGDLELIKELTLKPHGNEPPLKVTIEDDLGASPLSVAVMQGHLDVAEAILEICLAQWSPKKTEDNTRYTMGAHDHYDESDDSYDSDTDDDDVRVLKRIIDDKFTVENVGEVSLQVDSHTSPLEYLNWPCPNKILIKDKELSTQPNSTGLLGFAIASDDHRLLKWILHFGRHYSTLRTESGIAPVGTFFNVNTNHLQHAIECGRTEMIGMLIRDTGSGIPFEDLVKKSGIKDAEEPKYYQGLSVHGKKRADWAAAGRRSQVPKTSSGTSISPLLVAAKVGNLASLEYLLSGTPIRLYHEFVEKHADDKRVKRLSQADGGIEKAITEWYYAHEDCLIPSVIVGSPGVDADKRLEYLLNAVPSSIDIKMESGETPLQLAFKLGRHSAARMLLAAGADVKARDKRANNLMHKLLENFRADHKEHTVEKLSAMLELLEESTKRLMLTQRNAAAEGGGSPLQNWVNSVTQPNRYRYSWSYDARDDSQDGQKDRTVHTVKALLSHSGGHELDIINGSGDTLLHNVIAARQCDLVKLLIDWEPKLLYRENATGRVPLELAHDLYTAVVLKNPPDVGTPHQSSYLFGYNNNDVKTITDHNPDTFLRDKTSKRTDEEKIWELCREVSAAHPGARRLVSLNEANEVARRVGDMAKVSKEDARKARMVARGDVLSDEEVEEHEKNVVTEWLANGLAWEVTNA